MALVVVPGASASAGFPEGQVPFERGTVAGLTPARALSDQLPSVLAEDDFCVRLCEALDEVSAPIYSVLDCLASYLDPELAPVDFLDWIAGWVGVQIDEHWPTERRRSLVRSAVRLYASRGTAAGLSEHVELYTGVAPEIHDSGGCSWSQTAMSPLPGSPDPYLVVRVEADDTESVDRRTLDRIVDGSRPAHVPATVEIRSRSGVAMSSDSLGPGVDDEPSAGPLGAVDLPGSERIEMEAPGLDESSDAYESSDADEGVLGHVDDPGTSGEQEGPSD